MQMRTADTQTPSSHIVFRSPKVQTHHDYPQRTVPGMPFFRGFVTRRAGRHRRHALPNDMRKSSCLPHEYVTAVDEWNWQGGAASQVWNDNFNFVGVFASSAVTQSITTVCSPRLSAEAGLFVLYPARRPK